MIDLLKLVLILTLTIVLLMRKWDLGLVLLIDTPLLVSFFVPHLIDLLTGTPPAAIALSIPLVAPLMDASRFDPVAGGVWVFAGAFSGILMSPLHLCLALTREYFGANWGRLYRFIAPATAPVIAVALGTVIWKSGA